MSWARRLMNLLRDEKHSRELDRELAFHIAERADELRARGMSAEAAEHEARRRLGNYTLQKERTREVDIVAWLDTFRADVRYAVRALRSSPVFALVAVLSLALGIGANTAIFSLMDALVLRSLPVKAPEELVQITLGDRGSIFTNPLWEELRDRQNGFAGVAAFGEESFNLAAGGEARHIPGTWVSGDFFNMLGVSATLGRLITVADDHRGCPAIAVLGAGFWRSEYGGARDVIGRTIQLHGHPFQITGVVDPAFSGVTVGRASSVYVPLCAEAAISGSNRNLEARSRWWLHVFGRLDPGAGPEAVKARLAAIAPAAYGATVPEQYRPADQQSYRTGTFDVSPASAGVSDVRAQYSGALKLMMGAVAAVLLIACANVANLLLARATARQREVALRLAIGAGRMRIVRQLLTESLVLALLSSVLGFAIAAWASRALVSLISSRQDAIALDLPLDLRVLGFTLVTATAAAVVFGLAPALRAGRVDPQQTLRASSRGILTGSSRFSTGKLLVSGQIALSLALVVGAGLLLGTFRTLLNSDAGFHRDRVLLVDVTQRLPATARSGSPVERLERSKALHDALLERIRAIPGAVSASASQITPLSGMAWNDLISTATFQPAEPRDALSYFNEVTPGYFATLGTPLLAGRDFDERDRHGSTPVAIVNERMARKFFGTTNAVGSVFRLGGTDGPEYQVIGVVGNSKYRTLREETEPITYLARSQSDEPVSSMTFAVLATGSTDGTIQGIRQITAELEPSLILQFTSLREQVSSSLIRERMLAVLSVAFGGLALLLAIIGLYGIMSYNVARRRNEIGIRIALGSERTGVARMIMAEAGILLAIGLVAGVGLALAGSRLVSGFVFGLKPNDPTTIAAAVLLFAAVGLAASGIPALRAARVNPMIALREE